VPYFTAVIASDGHGWRARDVDVEECSDLADLSDRLRGVAFGDEPVLCVIEREDGWFGLVRADGEEDVRLFVSDLAAANGGHYAPVLASAGDADLYQPAGAPPDAAVEAAPVEPEAPDPGPEPDPDAAEPDIVEDDLVLAMDPAVLAVPEPEPVILWAGDPTLLSDLGVSPQELVELVQDNPDDPAAVLGAIGEVVEFADLLEALR